MFAAARLYQHKDLVTETLNFTDNHALEVLQSDAFLNLSNVSCTTTKYNNLLLLLFINIF